MHTPDNHEYVPVWSSLNGVAAKLIKNLKIGVGIADSRFKNTIKPGFPCQSLRKASSVGTLCLQTADD